MKVKILILDNQSLTEEVLSRGRSMCLVEQILNARPLTALSDDPEDLTALISIHFSLGQENTSGSFRSYIERYHDLRKFATLLNYITA